MKLCSLLFGFFLVAGAGCANPHVLFISIDDMNDYISPLDNHPGIKTPNFDRLAKRINRLVGGNSGHRSKFVAIHL